MNVYVGAMANAICLSRVNFRKILRKSTPSPKTLFILNSCYGSKQPCSSLLHASVTTFSS